MTVAFKRQTDADRWPEPGTYRKTDVGGGRFSAVISCPECKTTGSLQGSHEVAPDGAVTPSVVCDCGFHEFIELAGYADA